MLTKEEYAEARALRGQGWSISAISRHLARDRKTVRDYLGGERVAGVRRPVADEFQRFLPYCRQRLAEAAHMQATELFDEVVALGYLGGYSTFTRALRKHQVRPLCALCCRNLSKDGAPAPHPAREEVRFAWLKLPDPPARWGYGSCARLLVGALASTGRWRAVLTDDSEDFPQLVEAIDQVLRRLGGTARIWRFDQPLAVFSQSTGKVKRAFAQVAEFYGVGIGFPPWQGSRHVMSEEDLRSVSQNWWSTVGDGTRIQVAQDSLDQLAAWMDRRRQFTRIARAAGGVHAGAQRLQELPDTPFPAQICVMRTVTSDGMVPFRGNFYAVQPDLSDAAVEVRWSLDEPCLSIATAGGAVIARHTVAPQGAGETVTSRSHAVVLDRPPRAVPAKSAFCPGSVSRPPGAAAMAEADALRESAHGQFRLGVRSRIAIAQAKGVVAAGRSIGIDEAFVLLRDHAQAHRQSLADLARNVIDGTTDVSLLGCPAGSPPVAHPDPTAPSWVHVHPGTGSAAEARSQLGAVPPSADRLGDHASQESGVPEQIAPPQSAGFAAQSEEPFEAAVLNPR
ncbi:hypothetical protein ABH941_007353 [Streptacidiphilus sp. EB103A]